MANAIVTGANGFLGHHLVNTLSRRGYKIYAIVRNEQENIDNIEKNENVQIIYCDMDKIELIEEYLKNIRIDCVYHMAWAGSSGELRTDYNLQMSNVLWTTKLIETIARMKINRLLIAGSVTQLMYRDYLQEDDITPEMITIYAIEKINAEYLSKCLCTKYDIDLCWTYISNFYGSDDTTGNFINYLLDHYMSGETPILTDAKQLADFTYVTDIVEGLICACEKGKRNTSYYIGYGEPKPLHYYIEKVRDIVNVSLESGIGKKVFNGRSVDFDKINVRKLHSDTDFKPLVEFEAGIKKCVEAHKINI